MRGKTTVSAVMAAMVAAVVVSGCTSGTNASADGGSTARTGGAPTAASDATTPTAGTTGAGGGAGTPSCADAQLKVTTTSAGAGAGHVGLIVVFTNTGTTRCSVQGYPGAGVTDQPGQVVLDAIRLRDGYLGGQYQNPSVVSLAPGAAASTVIEWLDAPPDGETPVGANCPGMDGGRLLVTPPNTEGPASFPAPGDLCSGFEVHPLVPGSTGRSS